MQANPALVSFQMFPPVGDSKHDYPKYLKHQNFEEMEEKLRTLYHSYMMNCIYFFSRVVYTFQKKVTTIIKSFKQSGPTQEQN